VPLTPAYEGRAVRYADGEFDLKFDRYIIVREGDHYVTTCNLSTSSVFVLGTSPSFLISRKDVSRQHELPNSTSPLWLAPDWYFCHCWTADSRQAGKEAVNEIVSVELNGDPNAGKAFHFPKLDPVFRWQKCKCWNRNVWLHMNCLHLDHVVWSYLIIFGVHGEGSRTKSAGEGQWLLYVSKAKPRWPKACLGGVVSPKYAMGPNLCVGWRSLRLWVSVLSAPFLPISLCWHCHFL
jgi:hypothetical protein